MPDQTTADPIAAAYSAAASAANSGTLAARPGSTATVAGEQIAPVSDDELAARVEGLLSVAEALLTGVSTLRDSDAAERNRIVERLTRATQHVGNAARELHALTYPAGVQD